jgi:hypothetical protein
LNDITPPLDLDDYRGRARRIYEHRVKAREERERHALEEADAENEFQRTRAAALLRHREEGVAWGAAEKLAEADAAEHKRRRDRARALKRSAELRIEELERNATSLNREAQMSGGIEGR